MNGEDELEALARRWLEAINARDADALAAEAGPDVHCYPLQLGVTGHYAGPEGLAEWMRELVANDPGHQVRVDSSRSLGGGRVALFGTVIGGEEELSPYAFVAEVRDGKVVSMRSYLTDETTLDRLGILD